METGEDLYERAGRSEATEDADQALREKNRHLWYHYHRSMHGLHTELAGEHEAKADALLEELRNERL